MMSSFSAIKSVLNWPARWPNVKAYFNHPVHIYYQLVGMEWVVGGLGLALVGGAAYVRSKTSLPWEDAKLLVKLLQVTRHTKVRACGASCILCSCYRLGSTF